MMFPHSSESRIHSLDVIRGFAVLGILAMNIRAFGLPEGSYLDPFSYGNPSFLDLIIFTVTDVVFREKCMGIFSLLFGVGVLIFTQKPEQKQLNAWQLHKRRCLWLLSFGLFHSYFIWSGDILTLYAACGFLIYAFRHQSVKHLFIIGTAFILLETCLTLLFDLIFMFADEALQGELQAEISPSKEAIQIELDGYESMSWLEKFWVRADNSLQMQLGYIMLILGRTTGLMLWGMALYKLGFFNLTWQASRYFKIAITSLVIGLSLEAIHAQFVFSDGGFRYLQFVVSLWASLAMLLAYMSIFLWVLSKGYLKTLTLILASCGRMAFTLYIMQSLICTSLFWGLGMFAEFTYSQLFLVVMTIWVLQITFAHFWWQGFKQGPLEYMWRRLTYLK
ncbi:DUF418 domain-containing protein [Glaciecola sp. 1036]|uniref:DUF418 domain-containing protein n=1 Tax=Alteromonadaceae TaxID=72275 RepID=UPI003D02392D